MNNIQFNRSELIGLVTKQYRLSLSGIHGVCNWRRVEQHGHRLAITTGASPDFITLFAYLLDSCRRYDGRDRHHGRWPRAVGRVHRQTLGHIRCHGMKTASQLDELVVLKRLKYCAVQVREVGRHLRVHAQSESELTPLFKPKIHGKSGQSHFAAPQNPGSERVHYKV